MAAASLASSGVNCQPLRAVIPSLSSAQHRLLASLLSPDPGQRSEADFGQIHVDFSEGPLSAAFT